MTAFCAAKIICIHNKLTKSQSPERATHFFDFLFGRSLSALVCFRAVLVEKGSLGIRVELR